ncbi:Beta-ketoacyl synthase [Segniliparus rotundus DSM 44985]|uniref:Beta-ketoacyl synthase n=1 Tax=Segniliparus rotundus (strain ATCC BAA-972 / CDC 1076 / CIP 108378 / DSM 44985 / JCM 13578) TaxID=640132 RepID=D6ZCY5_SEGRD|nr:KasA/KasB family beta-ketoacyl-ACP synthase [Segniliparus rotundus]ADG99172.1 Beta-ketoacyl synthase [Segniliparus rotundus DSM 44985]
MSSATTLNGGYPSIVITGMHAVSGLGHDVDTTWNNLLAGKSGVEKLETARLTGLSLEGLPAQIGSQLKFDPTETLSRVEKRRMSYTQQLGVVVARQLWEEAGKPEVDGDRLAVIVGSGLGGGDAMLDTIDRMRDGGYKKVSPLSVQMIMANGTAAVIGLELGARAGVVTPISACATGTEALVHAWQMIAMGDADMVIAGGVESTIDAIPIACFSMMRALSTQNDDPKAASRPFDKDRKGFVFGEGGALLIIEREEHAKARGAKILARLMGVGLTSDAFHMVAPDLEGKGAERAMRRAIERAGVTASDITYVNAHATGTDVGDPAEAMAINRAIGDHPAVYAPKSALGHSIGATGALETILTVKALEEGISPPTLNLDNKDPEINLDVIHGENRKGDFQFAINNSFGFGGHNAAVVLGKA